MNLNTWVTSLIRLPIRIYFQHYVELIILIIILIYYRNLRSNRLGIVLPLWIACLSLDLICRNLSFYWNISIVHILPFFIFILGIYLFPGLRRLRIGMLIPIMIIDLILDNIEYNYARHGMYNIFAFNFFYIIATPFFFILFYNMLQPQKKNKIFFIVITILSIVFFLYEYFNNNEVRLNYITIIVFRLQCIMLGCLTIARLVMDENNSANLTGEPFFWICAGQVLVSIVIIICDGLHPYLVTNYIEIYNRYHWLIYVSPVASMVVSFCNAYAFILCGKRYQDRLSFSFRLGRGIW
jgi:hypothetical protein